MAAPIITTVGSAKLQRAFNQMAAGSAREVREVIRAAIGPMLHVAQEQAYRRRRTGELGDAWRAQVSGSRGRLINPLPQSRPLEFGGTIAPKGAPISLAPPTHMVYGPGGAIEKGKPITEKALRVGFATLARRSGFA